MSKKKKTSKNKKNESPSSSEKQASVVTSKKQKSAEKASKKEVKPAVDFFEQSLGAKSTYLVLALLCVIAFMVYGSFWFTDNVFLFKDIGSDTINGLYPIYYWNAENWATEGAFPSWSFATGLGQNIMVMNMGDPFVWLMYLAGKDNIIHCLAYMEATKVVLAGMVFYAYLRTMSMTYLASVAGGLIYAFSGFMMVGSGWYLFTIEGLYFALLLLAFERFILHGKWGLFPVVLMLISMWQPVDVYIFAVCIATYGTIRILDRNDFDWKDLGLKFLQLAGLGALGLMMGAMVLFPSVELILNSPRVLGESTFFDTLQSKSIFEMTNPDLWATTKARFMSTNLLVNDVNGQSAFRGAMNFLEAPALYCSAAAMLLVPQVFSFLNKKGRILYGILLGLYLLPLLFPFLRYSFWLFAGDYYRFYSLFVIFIMVYLSVRSIHFIYTEKRVSWVGFGIGAVLALYLLFSIGSGESGLVVVNQANQQFVALLIVLNALLIAGWSMESFRPMARIAFLAVLVIDLVSVARPTLNDRDMATVGEFTYDKVGYNDYTVDAIQYIKSVDPSFHRVEKFYQSGLAMHGSMNDAKVQGYMGSKSYHSFNQLNYIRFLGALDIVNQADENQTRWAPGVSARQLLNTLISNKYILTKEGPDRAVGAGYKYVRNFENVALWENTHFLPFGFTYDKMILRSNFDKIKKDNVSKDITLLKAVVIEDEDKALVSKLSPLDTNSIQPQFYSEDALATDVNERKAEAFEMEKFTNAHFTGKIKVSKDKMLFFSMPLDKGWTAKVDGQVVPLQKINIGFSGLMLTAGEHQIEMTYNTPYASLGRWISLVAILLYGAAMWWWYKKSQAGVVEREEEEVEVEKEEEESVD